MKIESLQPGMTVWDLTRTRMGNTSMTTLSLYPVRIISVDAATATVVASWNSNPPPKCGSSRWKKWRLNKPLLIRSAIGRQRLATRDEIKAAAASLSEQDAAS